MREATVRIVKMLAEKDVNVTQRGARAYVQYSHTGRPVRVNIPYIPDDATEELLDAIQGFMDHEVAHILFTDYTVLAKAKSLKLTQIHNIVEDSFIERKMAEQFAGSGANLRSVAEFFLKNSTDRDLAATPSAAEGILLVPAIRAWAGQTVFIDYMADKWHLIEELTSALGDIVKKIALCASSQDCLNVSVEMNDALAAARPKPPAAPPAPAPEPEDEESAPPSGPIGSLEDPEEGLASPDDEPEPPETDPEDEGEGEDESGSAKTFKRTKPKSEPEPEPEPEPESEPKPESEESTASVAEDEPSDPEEEVPTVDDPAEPDEGLTGEDEPAVEDIEESHTGATSEPEESEEPEGSEGEGAAGGPEEDDESMPGDDHSGSEVPSILDRVMEAGVRDYDEALSDAIEERSAEESKCSKYLVYTTELDLIEPLEPRSGRYGVPIESALKEMTDSVDHMLGPMQKDFERAMAAKSASSWSTGHRTGRLNPSALARLTTFGDDRAFRRRHVTESKDVAVTLFVDCSGSMSGSKIRTAAYAAYGLSSVLDRMNITHEVLGFTTHCDMPPEMTSEAARLGIRYARNEAIYIPIIKGFPERVSTEAKKRFASLVNADWLSENVDGESIQIAARRLSVRKEKRKILMVLSDGNPACPGDRAQLDAHLRKSARDIENSGIDLVAIGIQSEAPKSYYRKSVVLNNINDLPSAVIGQIRNLLI